MVFVVRALHGCGDPHPACRRHPSVGSDPPLNSAGLARAQKLGYVLGDAGIGTILVTRFQRTQQTADPLTADLGKTPLVIGNVDLVVVAMYS